jgi:hypothetical protein
VRVHERHAAALNGTEGERLVRLLVTMATSLC